MRCLYVMCVGLVLVKSSSTLRSIDDHTDSGTCTGEFKAGNSLFVPQRYSLYLDLHPKTEDFRGEVNITGTLNYKSTKSISNQEDSIELHSVNLNVISVRLNGKELKANASWFLNATIGTLNILLPQEVRDSEHQLIVGVSYEGVFNETTGIIMQNYNKTDEERWVIFTHLEPISARTVFPCIDLPKYKAKFDISIKNNSFSSGRTVLSNMPPLESDDRNVIKFQTTPLMSTYLVSFVVCDYLPVKTGDKKYKTRQITTWVPKEMKGKYGTNLVASLVPQLLEALEAYTGSRYSLPKLDMYVVMDKPGIGGMENWGLIMYQADSLVQGKRTSANDLARVIFTIAHELAHHWFGNSVTVADWCGMWFQEAIPTFLHGHIPETHSYDLDMVNRVKWTARKEVMDSECFFYDDSTPLRDVDNPRADEGTLFSLARYFKGANLLYMIESMVTPGVFKEALRSFYVQYNNSYATEDELWAMMKEKVGGNGILGELSAQTTLAEIAATWVTNRSHPIVVLTRTKDGKLRLGQRVCIQKFIMDGEWYIPISYTTSRDANFNNTMPREWILPMGDEYQHIDNIRLNNDEWIILNVMGSGFYRVQYDNVTWKLIIKQLKKDTAGDVENAVIPPIHRAMLIDDSFHTANTGEGLVKVFDIMQYLKRETSAYVWEALVINVGYQYGEFPNEVKDSFKQYMQFLLQDVFSTIANIKTWDEAYNQKLETVNERSLRESVFDLSYTMELPAMKTFSKAAAMEVINNKMNEKIIPPEVKTKLWCAAVSTGDENIFDYVYSAYNSEKDDKKKAQIFERLQCSKNQTRLLLNLILRVQSNSDGSKATLLKNVKEFLVHHWPAECKEILSYFDGDETKKNNSKIGGIGRWSELVDDKSQLASEFKGYVKSPLSECRDKTEELFGTNPTDDAEDNYDEWNKTYGTEPLKWLNRHKHQWGLTA